MAEPQGRPTGRCVRATKSKPAHAQKSPKARLPKGILRKVASEAKALGLTQEEYMRLVLAVSSALRGGLVSSGRVNAKGLLTVVDNPLFSAMIQALAHSVRSQIEKQNDEPGDSAASQGDAQTGQQQVEGQPSPLQKRPNSNGEPFSDAGGPNSAQQRPVQPGPMWIDPFVAPPPAPRQGTNPPDWTYW